MHLDLVLQSFSFQVSSSSQHAVNVFMVFSWLRIGGYTEGNKKQAKPKYPH